MTAQCIKIINKLKKNMSGIGTKREVFQGKARTTAGGLTKGDIKRNSIKRIDGSTTYRYVSRVKSELGKKNPWIAAVMRARKVTGDTGMIQKGTKTYELARKYLDEAQREYGSGRPKVRKTSTARGSRGKVTPSTSRGTRGKASSAAARGSRGGKTSPGSRGKTSRGRRVQWSGSNRFLMGSK